MFLSHLLLPDAHGTAKFQVAGKPNDVASAEAALAQMRQQQQRSIEAGTSSEARFGAADQSMTKALTRCLQVDTQNQSAILHGDKCGFPRLYKMTLFVDLLLVKCSKQCSAHIVLRRKEAYHVLVIGYAGVCF